MQPRVLIVDDSRVLRLAMHKAAVQAGIPAEHLAQAGDGQAALTWVREHEVDLVLLDLNLPEMDGEQFLRELRQDPRHQDVAVVLVTAEGNRQRLAALHALGVQGSLHKPFEPEQLRALLIEFLGAPR